MSTTSAADSLNHDPLLRETLAGRYYIERLIGRGGVGLVYLATDKQESRRVVVKVLAPHWTDDEDAVARFDREALRMAKLDHPNVVKMYDHGHHRDQAFIVMEFLDGEPLRQYLNRKKYLGFEEFIPIASQILAGVGYVHARNIMLRDIKPPNIMLCERDGKANHVKLLDFGLAKLMGEDDELTKAHVIGTAGYLSPEQIRGDKIDVRVDVYALGILFFIMLTGQSPIEGDNDAAVLFNHVHGTPRALRDALPTGHRVPAEVLDLIGQSLAKLPRDRPADANEMAEVLFESVHPSMFLLPTASEQTRAPARDFWEKRLKKGGGSLEDLEPHSGEFTRPVVKRTLEEARSAANLERGPAPPQSQKPKSARPKSAQPRPAQPKSAQPKAAAAKPKGPDPGSTALGLPKAVPGRITRPPKPPPLPPKPSQTTLGLPIPKSKTRSPSSPAISTAGTPSDAKTLPPDAALAPIRGPDRPRAATPRPHKPRPTPTGSAAVARSSSGPNALPIAPMPTGPAAPPVPPTQQFNAADARAAATREHGPTARVDAKLAAAAAVALGDGIPGTVARTSDDDSLPISFEEEIAAPTPDVTAVGTGPITAIGAPVAPASGRLSLVFVLAGLGALALGGVTAFFALADGDPPVAASNAAPDEKKGSAPAGPDAKGDAGEASSDAEAKAEGPEPSDGEDEVVVAVDDAAADDGPSEPVVGKVAIEGRAGAQVFVDGEPAGALPRTLELSPGKHTVRVEASGYEPWERSVEVEAGEGNRPVVAELVKRRGATPPKVPKPGVTKPRPRDPEPESPKVEPKPKPKGDDVFIDTKKGNDDAGIFLPVGN